MSTTTQNFQIQTQNFHVLPDSLKIFLLKIIRLSEIKVTRLQVIHTWSWGKIPQNGRKQKTPKAINKDPPTTAKDLPNWKKIITQKLKQILHDKRGKAIKARNPEKSLRDRFYGSWINDPSLT